MPIKNLTSRNDLKPSLQVIGKLRKGGEKSGNKPGPDLDHFRFTSDDPAVVRAFRDAYGDKPKMVNVVMFYETTEENFPSWIEAWDASGMVFRSDGENWLIWREGSQYRKGKKPHVDSKDQFEVGRLEVVIPELVQAGFAGTVLMETHSNHDLRNITSTLYAVEEQRGGLRGAFFTLRRYESEISVPGWGDRAGQRSKAKKWLVRLDTPTEVYLPLASGDGYNAPQLSAPDDIAEGEIISSLTVDQEKTFIAIQQRTGNFYSTPDHLVEYMQGETIPPLSEAGEYGKSAVAMAFGMIAAQLVPADDDGQTADFQVAHRAKTLIEATLDNPAAFLAAVYGVDSVNGLTQSQAFGLGKMIKKQPDTVRMYAASLQ